MCDPCFAEASSKRVSEAAPDSSGDDDSDEMNNNENRQVSVVKIFVYIWGGGHPHSPIYNHEMSMGIW